MCGGVSKYFHHEDSSPYLYSSSSPVGPTSCEYCGRRNTAHCPSNLPREYFSNKGRGDNGGSNRNDSYDNNQDSSVLQTRRTSRVTVQNCSSSKSDLPSQRLTDGIQSQNTEQTYSNLPAPSKVWVGDGARYAGNSERMREAPGPMGEEERMRTTTPW